MCKDQNQPGYQGKGHRTCRRMTMRLGPKAQIVEPWIHVVRGPYADHSSLWTTSPSAAPIAGASITPS